MGEKTPTVFSFSGNVGPCAKVHKLREIVNGREIWCDWCYKHHHWLNGDHGVTRTSADELLESVGMKP